MTIDKATLADELERTDYEWHGPFGKEKHHIVPPALFDRILDALRASPGDRGAVASLWKPANANDAALGWPYDFAEIEQLRDEAQVATGYGATMEDVAHIMLVADNRFRALKSKPDAAVGGEGDTP